jgi:hypothetical protein
VEQNPSGNSDYKLVQHYSIECYEKTHLQGFAPLLLKVEKVKKKSFYNIWMI